MLLQLPPNYLYGGAATGKPVFHGTTVQTVLQNMSRCGRLTRHEGSDYYRCIYCDHDPTVRRLGERSCYHPPHLIQIDHIVPFALIVKAPNSYYGEDSYQIAAKVGLTAAFGFDPRSSAQRGPGNNAMDIEPKVFAWDMKEPGHKAVLYNDINNLHAVCAGHNQHKGGQDNYLGLSSDQIFATYRGQLGH